MKFLSILLLVSVLSGCASERAWRGSNGSLDYHRWAMRTNY
jgi:uncharacterized protein YceK